MKRSKKIALVIIASVTLTSCGSNNQQTQRDVYATKEKCAEDWGESNCEDTSTPADSSGVHHYMGPHYYTYGGRPYFFPGGRSPTSEPVQATSVPRFRNGIGHSSSSASHTISSSVSRGGFGHSGRSGS